MRPAIETTYSTGASRASNRGVQDRAGADRSTTGAGVASKPDRDLHRGPWFVAFLRQWDRGVEAAAHRLSWPAAYRAYAVLCVVFAAPPLCRAILTPSRHNKDYDLWMEVGRRVLDGRDLYSHAAGEGIRYMYPPFPAVVFMAPLAAGGPLLVVSVVVLLNLLAWSISIALSIRLVRGRLRGVPAAMVAFPAAATAPYVWDNFFLGQPNLVLLALMLAGFNLLIGRRHVVAGACFALAAAVKAFPILVLPYLLYRRCWRASIAMVGALAILLVLVPAPFRGLGRNARELGEWAFAVMEPSGSRLGAGGAAMDWGNQSLFGLIHRLTRPLPLRGSSGSDTFTVNLVSMKPQYAQTVVGAVGLAAAVLFIRWTAWRRAPERMRSAVEAAALLVLMLVFCPVSRTYMFCWLMPSAAVWIHLVVDRRSDPGERTVLVIGGIAAFGLLATALTQGLTPVPQALGVTTVGAVLLSAMLLRRIRPGVELAEVQS